MVAKEYKRYLPLIPCAAAYAAYGAWLFTTKPPVPDHAVIAAGLITYVGLGVIALAVLGRIGRWAYRRRANA